MMKGFYRLFNMFLGVCMALASLAGPHPALAGAHVGSAHKLAAGEYVPGQLVVGFAGVVGQQNAAAQASALAGTVNAQVTKVQGNLVLLSFSPDANLDDLIGQISAQAGVAFAEPNYLYSLPKQQTLPEAVKASPFQQAYVLRNSVKSAKLGGSFSNGKLTLSPGSGQAVAPTGSAGLQVVPMAALRAMKSVVGGKTMATYPNDSFLWQGGWSWLGADIVWTNATPSAGICEIDTGVDYLHPDLAGKILKGYDFVNGDADPMDDEGHGTHVAGIMVALKNNAKGIAGVSTGTVLAVKALDSQGVGTNMDIAAAIAYCANNLSVKVITMSLGSPNPSTAIYNNLNLAINTKGKLVVAAAGNDGQDVPVYPAFYGNNDVNGSAACAGSCPTYPTLAAGILVVGASGYSYQPDPVTQPNWWIVDYSCQGGAYDTDLAAPTHYSNFGAWVKVVAPGTDIYSTLPYDKPFWLNATDGYLTRYDSMTGTSMATPYVAATAARRWGYKPLEANTQIAADVIASGGSNFGLDTTDYTGDSDPGTAQIGQCWPASMSGRRQANVAANLDRGGASAAAFDASVSTALNGATLTVYHYPAMSTVIATGIVTATTSKAMPWETDPTRIYTSYSNSVDLLNLPVDLGWNFTAKVNKIGYTASAQPLMWWNDVEPGNWSWLGRALVPPKSGNFDVVATWYGWNYTTDDRPDLDLNVWLPSIPNGYPGQPANFMVGPEGSTYQEVEPIGGMTYFPFARAKRDGGGLDFNPIEDITIRNRSAAHDGLAANLALPYYAGTYTVNLTDYGQVSSGSPLLGGDANQPYVLVWKDGLLKYSEFGSCNDHWWGALTITSGVSGVAAYGDIDSCGSATFGPY